MNELNGHISQIIGPVVDVYFELNGTGNADLPAINDALTVLRDNGKPIVLEVQQHIGENTVRTVAMDSTDGLRRKMPVIASGSPINMPSGLKTRGRLLNVTGDAIDGLKDLEKDAHNPIHREPPKFEDLATTTEVLFTGIKVIDLIEPYSKGGKIGLFGEIGRAHV